MHELFLNCSKVVDDVPQLLRGINEEQMKIVFPLCSQKYKDCKHNSTAKIQGFIKNDQNDDSPKHSPEEMQKFKLEKLVTIFYYSNFGRSMILFSLVNRNVV